MRILFLTYLFLFTTGVFAQADSVKLVKYTSGFRFREGIYLNHEQMVQNHPIRKQMIISKYNKKDFDFFTKLLSDDYITYFDRYGLKKEVEVSSLWGFCRRGSVFINYGDDFNRIPVMGAICHFVANITVYEDQFSSPSSGFSYYDMPTRTPRTEINQYIMEFETGKVFDYNVDNVEMLLMRDAILYDEFIAYKKKKKKQLKFLYVRKLNEKFPLYIPIE